MRNRSILFIALCFPALVALTAFLSWPALTGPFLFDDFPNLELLAELNGHLDFHSLANYAALFQGGPGRPLSMLSFVINDVDWPSTPWSFKYTNLMLHLLTGTLIFGFSRSLLKFDIARPAHADIAALLAATAWLLHPIQLSTSMLVVQRMTQLSAIFTVAGLWGYVTAVRRARTPTSALIAILALGLGTALAVLSKETGALAPLLAVVINATLLRQHLLTLSPTTRRILQVGTALPVLLLFAIIAVRFEGLTGYGRRPFDMAERVLSQARVVCDYIYNIVVPNLRGGGIYQDDFEISRSLLTPWTTLPAVLILAALLLVAFSLRRRNPLLSFGLLWFFCGHLLESTIFPLELYFEHRNYLPMFGIVLCLSGIAVKAFAAGRRWAMVLSTVWIAYAAWLMSIQAPIWGSRDALIAVWAVEHPNSPRAVQERSALYYFRGEPNNAANTLLDAYERGVRGSDFPSQVLLLACTLNDGQLAGRARALVPASLEVGEFNRATLITLRKLRRQVQKDKCPTLVTMDEWLDLTTTLLRNPKFSTGKTAAYIHTERAYLYTHLRHLDATMREYEAAWDASPTPALARLIAVTLNSAGLHDQAIIWANLAVQHRPKGIRGWLSSSDRRSEELRDALETIAKGATRPLVPSKDSGANQE